MVGFKASTVKLDVGFPAWCFDHFYPNEALLSAAAAEFPDINDPRWQTFHGDHEPNKQQGGPTCWGPITTSILLEFMSPKVCQQVAELVGCQVLVADIVGGGMHQSGQGAHLDTHVDFDRHPDTGWRRAVNFLVYLNKG